MWSQRWDGGKINERARVVSLRSGAVCLPCFTWIYFCVFAGSVIELRFHEKVTCPCSYTVVLYFWSKHRLLCSMISRIRTRRRPQDSPQACVVVVEAPWFFLKALEMVLTGYCRQWGIHLAWTKKGNQRGLCWKDISLFYILEKERERKFITTIIIGGVRGGKRYVHTITV